VIKMTSKVKDWGGPRKGAGRKPTGIPPKKPLSVRVTDAEADRIKKLIKEMRSEKCLN